MRQIIHIDLKVLVRILAGVSDSFMKMVTGDQNADYT